MAHRVTELTLVSAHDLEDVNTFSDMEVYAVASVSSDPLTRQRTRTDRRGGTDPSWDVEGGGGSGSHRFVVPQTAAAAAASGDSLRVVLRTERFFGDDRDVGEVVVPLADILAGACASGGATMPRCASYEVRRCGVLRVSYRLGPVVAPLPMPMPPPPAPGRCYDYGDDPYYHRPAPPPPPPYYPYARPPYYGGYPAPPYSQVEPPPGYPPPRPYARTPAPAPKKKSSGGDFFGLGGIGGMLFGNTRMLPSSSDTTSVVDGGK